MKEDNKHLWNQFCRLGEMIGDGIHYEEPWISKEYKKLSRILIPEIREEEKKRQTVKNKSRDKQIDNLLDKFKCECGGKCKQVRSGSLTVKCDCGKKYKAKTEPKKK